MLTKRIIPCLDIKDGRVVKGTQFIALKDAGDPVLLARRYEEEGADELVLLDIAASLEERGTFLEIVELVAKNLSIPFTVGGGVRGVPDIRRLLCAGADKVAINTSALASPQLIREAAKSFGSQSLVLAMDIKRAGEGWEVFSHGGTKAACRDALEWALTAEKLGAGEILATSIDRDGTKKGYDLELIKSLSASLRIPVVASGGACGQEDIRDVFVFANADGALAASLFHFGLCGIPQLKEYLSNENIEVRR